MSCTFEERVKATGMAKGENHSTSLKSISACVSPYRSKSSI